MYDLNADGTAIVVDITNENVKELVIPDTIVSEGRTIKVTKIREACFKRCRAIVTASVGKNIEEIPDYAFAYCSGLETVVIGSGVKSIGNDAFEHCSNLKNVVFEEGSSLERVGNFAFQYCSGLSDIPLEETALKSIGFRAFCYCTGLEKISFERTGLQTIDDFAFFECSSLKTVMFEQDSVLESIGTGAFCHTALVSVKLPDELTVLPASVFSMCYQLVDIDLPSGLSSIEKEAFNSCVKLKSADFSKCSKLITIGINAFMNCRSLTELTIPDSVTAIGDYAFSNCSLVSEIVIGSSVKDSGAYYGIGTGAFRDCGSESQTPLEVVCRDNTNPLTIGCEAFKHTSVECMEIPDNVVTIKDVAFKNCEKLTTVRIGRGIKKLDIEAGEGLLNDSFPGCDSLTTVYIDSQTVADSPDNLSYLFTNAEAVYCLNDCTTKVEPSQNSYIRDAAGLGFRFVKTENNYDKYAGN